MKNFWLQFEDQRIPYQVQHKKTVTSRIHLRTAADGSLLILAPVGTRHTEIHQMLQARASRVAGFLVEAKRKREEAPQPGFTDGETHWFLGEPYRLKVVPARVPTQAVELKEGVIQCRVTESTPDRVEKQLDSWYRAQAVSYFSGRMALLAERTAWVTKAPQLRLRKMKRTWGSCSHRGVITLNTRLVKAPPKCIDYVIAHELCHLKVMNHSPDFYALQERLFPQWRQAKAHLRDKAHLYLTE